MTTLPEADLLQKCLVNAVIEVISITAGVTVCKVQESTILPQPGRVELTGAIMIQGERSALLSLKISKEYAVCIVSSMTGLDSQELSDEDLYDGVAEIVNMIAGRVKACMEVTGRGYSLTQPFTVVGENVMVIYKEQVPKKLMLKFVAGEAELYLVLTFL